MMTRKSFDTDVQLIKKGLGMHACTASRRGKDINAINVLFNVTLLNPKNFSVSEDQDTAQINKLRTCKGNRFHNREKRINSVNCNRENI